MIGRLGIAGKGIRGRAAGLALVSCAVAALASAAAPAGARAAPRGRLVVLIVVDQLRFADLLWGAPWFGPRGFGGLGAPIPLRYETLTTETAVGHATLSTGAWAEVHGVIGNRYWRDGRDREAVEDAACPVLGAQRSGKSAAALRAPTVGDALKLATSGRARAISISLKDRSALFLAGSSADAAVFWEPEAGGFTESSCTTPALPPWLSGLRARHTLERWKDWVWVPAHPEAVRAMAPLPSALPRAAEGLGDVFPHRVGTGAVDDRLLRVVRATPAGGALTFEAARAAVEGLGLGARETPDLLLLSLSDFDYVGHQFGTSAPERADALLRTHDELTAFVSFLRDRLGDRVAVVLTADHGATPNEPELRRAGVRTGGTLDLDELRARLEAAIAAAVPAQRGPFVDALEANAVWLKVPAEERAVQAALEALRSTPGIHFAGRSADPALPVHLRHGIFAGRTGQLVFELQPQWSAKRGAPLTEHGSTWRDDVEIPFLISAAAVQVQAREGRATQIAPTLSVLLGTGAPAAALDSPLIRRSADQ